VTQKPAAEAQEKLERFGMLLLTDSKLPSLAWLIAGERIRGSWWSHPSAHSIFAASEAVSHNADTLSIRLISGKWTFVHRRLWGEVLSVATSRDSWQLCGLTREERLLADLVESRGEVRADQLPTPARFAPVGDTIRRLESRLMIYTESRHTERGTHSKTLSSWDHWARSRRFQAPRVPPSIARDRLQGILDEWNRVYGAKARLPWHSHPKNRP
jgi:hypothetical protein